MIEFDPALKAIINAEDHHFPIDGFPEICIGVWSDRIVNKFVGEFGGEEIAGLQYCTGTVPIYKVTLYDTEVALYMAHVGAPSATSGIEEISCLGAKYFVYFGSCGVLRHDIADGHLIIPNAAVRDEGTSYHYLPASHEIVLDADCVALVQQAMDQLGLPYITGKTWTTDAFYRETAGKIQKRKEQGCICVEMECSAMAAVARFKGVKYAQFLFAADNLDTPEWDKRGLSGRGESGADKYMSAAVETGKLMRAFYTK